MVELVAKLRSSSLVKDSFWALAGNVLGKGLALLASMFVARFLGKDLFGTYGLVRTTLLTVAIFSTFGLGYTATKFVADYVVAAPNKVKGLINNISKITLVSASVIAVLVFVFSKQLAEYLKDPSIYISIRYLSVIIIFNAITTTQIGVLSGFKKFKQLARINLLNGVVTFALSVVLTYFYSINGAMIALLISQMYNCVQNFVEVRRSLAPYAKERVGNLMEILGFSLPIALYEMAYSVMSFVIPIILVRYSSTGELGLYNAAAQWSAAILFIPGALRNVILSHVAGDNDDEKQQHQRKTVNKMLVLNFLATFVPFLIVCIFAKFIVSMYGDSFSALDTVLRISVFTAIFNCMSSVLEQYFIAINRSWLMLSARIFRDMITVVLVVLGLTTLIDIQGAVVLACINVLMQGLTLTLYMVIYQFFCKKSVAE